MDEKTTDLFKILKKKCNLDDKKTKNVNNTSLDSKIMNKLC